MLQQITIENFRAFNGEVTVRVRPITILIGRNSSGKSSILKFLLMLRQTLESGDDKFLVTEGRHVHLGALTDLKHSAGKKRKLRFGLSMSGALPPDIWSEVEAEVESFHAHGYSQEGKREIRVPLPSAMPSRGRARPAQFNICADLFYRTPTVGSHEVSALVDNKVEFKRSSPNLSKTRFLKFPADTAIDPVVFIRAFRAEQYLFGIREEIKAVRHLAAIREESQRAIIIASPPPGDVGHFGEYAIPHLQRLYDAGGDQLDFILGHLERVANVDKLEFRASMRGYLRHCIARNKELNAFSYLADLGFGVSQCLPIFIQGTILHKRQLLTVEQPEAQLHPTAQLEMGTFFAELWRDRQVPSIVETHSANILIRLRKHISKQELKPEDVSVAYFHVVDGQVIVDNLDVDPNGKLSPGLPMEFFGADIIDSLGIR